MTTPSNPGAQYLALRAIKLGIDAALAVVEAQVDEVRAVFGSKSFDSPLGTLGLTVTKPKVDFPDEGKLLAYLEQLDTEADPLIDPAVDEEIPEQTIPAHTVRHPARVRPSARAELAKRCKITTDGVIDPTTGEVLDVRPGRPRLRALDGPPDPGGEGARRRRHRRPAGRRRRPPRPPRARPVTMTTEQPPTQPARRVRRRPITITTEVDVDVDPDDLEDAGWVYVGDGPTPKERDRTFGVILAWHDEVHPDPLKVCDEQPCRALREAGAV